MDWIPNICRRRKLYSDLSQEIRRHIEERTEQLIGEGMSLKEAEQQARAAFGNGTLLEQRSRDLWQWPTLESIAADVRFALRQLRKSPGFTTAAVLTLALAIGANAVVFGIMDGLVLRPLNVPQSQSLYGTHYGDNPRVAVVSQLHRSARSQPQLRGSGRFQHGPGSGIRCRQGSDSRKRLCHHRELLRRAAHSSLSWPHVSRI